MQQTTTYKQYTKNTWKSTKKQSIIFDHISFVCVCYFKRCMFSCVFLNIVFSVFLCFVLLSKLLLLDKITFIKPLFIYFSKGLHVSGSRKECGNLLSAVTCCTLAVCCHNKRDPCWSLTDMASSYICHILLCCGKFLMPSSQSAIKLKHNSSPAKYQQSIQNSFTFKNRDKNVEWCKWLPFVG